MSESEQIFEKMLSEAGIPTTEAGMRGRRASGRAWAAPVSYTHLTLPTT